MEMQLPEDPDVMFEFGEEEVDLVDVVLLAEAGMPRSMAWVCCERSRLRSLSSSSGSNISGTYSG